MNRPIVIVGGGFAGVNCARALETLLPRDRDVVLLGEENHICFTPLLAEVAGASIAPLHVVWPVRQMVRRVVCRTAEVIGIDPDRREVRYRALRGRTLAQPYDHLVLACGMTSHLDLMPGLAAHGFPLKRLGDALQLGNHVAGQLERAEIESDPERRRSLLTFVVIGGGFSGVEVAGELHDLLTASRPYFRSLGSDDIRMVLLHSRDRILPELPVELGHYAAGKMRARGIEVRLSSPVTAVSELGVRLGDGSEIACGTVVSTIGTTAVPLVVTSGLPLERGRIKTEYDLRVAGHSHIWALGDCAAVPNAEDRSICPPLAQFATRQAKHVAENLAATLSGRPTRPFRYAMKGSFAAIGHRNAVGRAFGVNFSGFLAWLLWRGFYLSQMPTLARKMQIAFDWLLQLFFPRDVVYLDPERSDRTARAHFEPGQFVFRKGDPADRFYIIEHGRVGIHPVEDLEPVATLGPGEHFGERSLIRSMPIPSR